MHLSPQYLSNLHDCRTHELKSNGVVSYETKPTTPHLQYLFLVAHGMDFFVFNDIFTLLPHQILGTEDDHDDNDHNQ
jgi:hypothetical protein